MENTYVLILKAKIKFLHSFVSIEAMPQSSVGSVQDLRTEDRWFDLQARPIFFPRTDDSHCDKMHSSLTAVHCFEDGYLGKQLVAWKKK